jgi:hypothetical protein
MLSRLYSSSFDIRYSIRQVTGTLHFLIPNVSNSELDKPDEMSKNRLATVGRLLTALQFGKPNAKQSSYAA